MNININNNKIIPQPPKPPSPIDNKQLLLQNNKLLFSRNSKENQRKFKCSECGKAYKHLCNLKSHSKIHTSEALICSHCNKRFGRRANYREHLRIHTGET